MKTSNKQMISVMVEVNRHRGSAHPDKAILDALIKLETALRNKMLPGRAGMNCKVTGKLQRD